MNQRVMLTKRLIKESLLDLLKKEDLYHISVKEICANSGINRSTFYAHYDSPRDVLLEIEREMAKEILSVGKVKHINELHQHLEMVCQYIYDHKDVQKIIMLNNTEDDIYHTLADATFGFSMPEAYLNKQSKDDELDMRIQTIFLTSGIYQVLKSWIIDDIDKTPKELADVLYSIIAKQF